MPMPRGLVDLKYKREAFYDFIKKNFSEIEKETWNSAKTIQQPIKKLSSKLLHLTATFFVIMFFLFLLCIGFLTEESLRFYAIIPGFLFVLSLWILKKRLIFLNKIIVFYGKKLHTDEAAFNLREIQRTPVWKGIIEKLERNKLDAYEYIEKINW